MKTALQIRLMAALAALNLSRHVTELKEGDIHPLLRPGGSFIAGYDTVELVGGLLDQMIPHMKVEFPPNYAVMANAAYFVGSLSKVGFDGGNIVGTQAITTLDALSKDDLEHVRIRTASHKNDDGTNAYELRASEEHIDLVKTDEFRMIIGTDAAPELEGKPNPDYGKEMLFTWFVGKHTYHPRISPFENLADHLPAVFQGKKVDSDSADNVAELVLNMRVEKSWDESFSVGFPDNVAGINLKPETTVKLERL